MANLIYRESTTATIPSTTSLKGSPLSNLEIDGNFRSINSHLSTHDTNISSITYDLSVINNNINTINSTKPSNTGVGATGTWAINISGNAATVTNGVYTSGNQTIGGTKTFSSTITGNISGNAATVTNGVYTNTDQTISGAKTFSSTENRLIRCYIGTNDCYLYESEAHAFSIRTGATGNYKYYTFNAAGDLNLSGKVTAGSFNGNGSEISSINATNISTGIINANRLPYASSSEKGAIRLSVSGTTLNIWTS